MIKELLEKYGIELKYINTFKEALTHRSYVNEANEPSSDYERLEYLGDAVLQLIMSEYLFNNYPKYPEGKLTTMRAQLVREESLASYARRLDYPKYIRLGNGEEKLGGREKDSVIANVFEAILGAIYLSYGIERTKNFMNEYVFPIIEEGDFRGVIDYKTMLQELVQSDNKITVVYNTVSVEGPSNAPVFKVNVTLENKTLGKGEGTSKKRAEQNAAKDALNKLATNN